MSRYCAFISYSHSDARFAAWLQRNLENFRIPPATLRKLDRDGNRLGPVFRDVADLGAATQLSSALTEALANSRALIIICSPEAAASDWVGLELEEFQRLHGKDALVLPIVSPRAGAAEAENLFPAALGESPPLAADARKSGDGRRMALLKLVAGLLGTGLDELVQRDARRRHTRLVAGISVATAVALVMTILALLAVSAREDAKRRLSQSEDLIGFMLGDLRKQLTPLGQVGVLESVGAKALSYFESLEDDDLTEAALLRKSRALYQIGEVYFDLGEFRAAERSFRLSLEQARQLASAQPDNTDRLFEWSQAEFWAGYAAWQAGDSEKAEEHMDIYHQVAWKLHERDPDNDDWVMETFWASNNLGGLAYSQAKYSDAVVHFRDAVARIDVLIAKEATTDRLYEKAATLSWLGSTWFHLGDLELSMRAFEAALDQPLDAENALHREERSYIFRKLGEVEVYRGEMVAARPHVTVALDIAGALSSSDPDSMGLLYARTTHALLLAQIDSYEGKAIAYGELAAAIDVLFRSDEPLLKWQALAAGVAEIGLRSGQLGSLERAKSILDRAQPEVASWDIVEREHLNLAVTAAEVDGSFVPVVRKLLPGVEKKYDQSRDFDLVLPMTRSYFLLGESAQLAVMQEVIENSGSLHPQFLQFLNPLPQ